MEKIILKIVRIDDIDITVEHFDKKTIIQDLKLLIYFKKDLKKRREIEVLEPNLSKYNDQTVEVCLLNKNHSLGKYKVVNEKTIEIDNSNDIINNLFELIDTEAVNNYSCVNSKGEDLWKDFPDKKYLEGIKYDSDKGVEEVFKEYRDLLSIYYNMVHLFAEFSDEEKIEGKVSAMCSYLAIKESFDKKLPKGYVVSKPNVFIKGFNKEFDYLIVKEDTGEKYIFDEKDVIALGEIKTAGIFYSKDNIKEQKNEKDEPIGFKSYLKSIKGKIDKPLIYTCLYESYGARPTSVHYYEYTLSNILSMKDVYGIYCVTKKDSDKYLIPYHYDLDKIIKQIINNK